MNNYWTWKLAQHKHPRQTPKNTSNTVNTNKKHIKYIHTICKTCMPKISREINSEDNWQVKSTQWIPLLQTHVWLDNYLIWTFISNLGDSIIRIHYPNTLCNQFTNGMTSQITGTTTHWVPWFDGILSVDPSRDAQPECGCLLKVHLHLYGQEEGWLGYSK